MALLNRLYVFKKVPTGRADNEFGLDSLGLGSTV